MRAALLELEEKYGVVVLKSNENENDNDNEEWRAELTHCTAIVEVSSVHEFDFQMAISLYCCCLIFYGVVR